MKIEKIVIPVAGLGTRLLPATKSQPKEMLPVGRKPVVHYVVEEAYSAGLNQVLFITGKNKRSIEDYFEYDEELTRRLESTSSHELLREINFEGINKTIFYVRQSVQIGLANAISLAEDFVSKEPFVVALGDSFFKGASKSGLLRRMKSIHLKTKCACTIAVQEVDKSNVVKYGIVKAKKKSTKGEFFEIADIIEKPSVETAPSNLAVAARYIFNPEIFDAIRRTVPDLKGELQITDSIRILLKKGFKVNCVKLSPDEKRYDIGNFESYYKAFLDFALADEKYGYKLRQYIVKNIK